MRRPADAGQAQSAGGRPAGAGPAGAAAAAATVAAATAAAAGRSGPEDRPLAPRRPRRAGIEQLPRRRGEGRRCACNTGNGSAGPSGASTRAAAAAVAGTGSRRTGRVQHGEGGDPPTAPAEAEAGAPWGRSDVADVAGIVDGLMLLLLLLLVMERRPRRRGQKGHRRRSVRWLLLLLLLWLVIPGHGSQLLIISEL